MKIDGPFQFKDMGTLSEANRLKITRQCGLLLCTTFSYLECYATTFKCLDVYRGAESNKFTEEEIIKGY